MSGDDVQFSKARIEMLCDGIFAIAMTLLVLELTTEDPIKRQAFGFVILLQPVSFAISLVLSIVAPSQAMTVQAISQVAIATTGRRRGNRVAPVAPA